MLKIPSISSHTVVWTHETAAHYTSTPEDRIWLPMWRGNENGYTCNASPEKGVHTSIKKNNQKKVPICKGLAKTIVQGTVKLGRKQARQKNRLKDKIRECSPSPRGQWRKKKMQETGCEVICAVPTILAAKG